MKLILHPKVIATYLILLKNLAAHIQAILVGFMKLIKQPIGGRINSPKS